MMPMPAAWASRGLVKCTVLAVVDDRPCVFLVDARQDLHQGRLAGAVFAHQGVDFAGHELEPDVVQRPDSGKGLADAADGNDRRRHDLGLHPGSVMPTQRPAAQQGTGIRTNAMRPPAAGCCAARLGPLHSAPLSPGEVMLRTRAFGNGAQLSGLITGRRSRTSGRRRESQAAFVLGRDSATMTSAATMTMPNAALRLDSDATAPNSGGETRPAA